MTTLGQLPEEKRRSMDRNQISAYEVFVGIDVGKASNYVVALDRLTDDKLIARSVIQEESAIRKVLIEASAKGRTLVVVDQCGAFGRLTVAVAQDMGLDVAHIPPRKFRLAAEPYGEDKSDAKDAFVIADVARSQPRFIEPVGTRAEAIAEIKVVTSCRDDAVRERTRCYNRLHDLIHQVCPPLEAVFSKKKLHNDLEIRLLARYGGPQGFRRAGKSRCAKWAGGLKYQKARGPERVEEVFEALSRQTVTLPATAVIEGQIKRIAVRIIELEAEEKAFNAELERLSELLPEVTLIRSIPGVGHVYGATIVVEIGDISRFRNAHHLASYGGIAPVKEESGSSVKKKKKRKGGNRRLKNALIQSAQCSLEFDPAAREYYDRKRAEGKKHRQAIRALARRRVELIYAMLSNGTYYEPLPTAA